MKLAAYVVAFGLIPLSGAAQTVNCRDPQMQMDMNICAQRDWQAADQRLNAAYKRAMSRAKLLDQDQPPAQSGAASALKAAQRAWLAFRDTNCAAESFAMKGGSGEPLIFYTCLGDMTKQRSRELLAFLAE